jgi:capsular polysaccharide transport system permease protein
VALAVSIPQNAVLSHYALELKHGRLGGHKRPETAMTMPSATLHAPKNKTLALFQEQCHIWYALMMHDIKTRFFGNGLGYIVTVLWPLGHILLILAINAGRLCPHGDSMILYAATAAIPFIAAQYISRFMMMGMMMNRSFMAYPIIKALDIIFARAFLELVSTYIGAAVILMGMAICGIDIMPIAPGQAVLAWLSAILLGLGFGMFNAVIVMAVPLWAIICIAFYITAWMTCGIAIDPELLPPQYGYLMSFNPLMHAVEWMRTAYYPDYTPRLLDKTYLVECGVGLFFVGLVSERLFRGFLLNPR